MIYDNKNIIQDVDLAQRLHELYTYNFVFSISPNVARYSLMYIYRIKHLVGRTESFDYRQILHLSSVSYDNW